MTVPGQRFAFSGDGYYLKTAEEMRHLWRDLPEACDNTLLIAERCDVAFTEGSGTFMPKFPCPPGENEDSWMVKEVERGLQVRYKGAVPDDVRKQAEFEIGVITRMGFAGYFLVVADFINWAKNNGIRVGPGRGSGAGSMVAYAMRITDLDPLVHGLIFERFLNPDRVSMPDFDIDFDERRRGEVIRYVTDKYGDERVSMIVTYGTIKAKQAVKDSSRILGYPFAMGDRITKAMPAAVMGKDVPLQEIFNPEHKRYGEGGEFRALYDGDNDVKKVVDTAMGIEGLKRQWGVHAAGVIMSSEPLLDIIPMLKRPADGAMITQFDYPTCENLGLIKMDFLGLRNLTVLDDALKNIQANRGETVVLEDLELTDEATYALLQRGDTLGVFQLDGGPMRALLRSMRPDTFEDISAVGALYRPGPMGADSHNKYARRKTGREPVEAIHPELAEPLADVLGETYGLIVYQEQVMAIAQKLAGYTLGQADILRRAMGKKKKEELDKQFAGFSEGMKSNGYSAAAIKTLWDILLPFSDYAFNKAHSAAYGLVSYWTAYLKANYPAEYMAALLTSTRDDKDKSAIYLNECRRMKIQVLPPDVNESAADFTPVGRDIRFGLTAVRNVGANVVDGIVAARTEKGRYADFDDFMGKVPALVCNKRVLESLIKAGAFDEMKLKRRALVAVHETAVDQYVDIKRNEAIGQDSLFAGLDDAEDGAFGISVAVPDIDEWDKMTLLGHERDMLGLYVSDHPLLGLEHVLSQGTDCTIGQLMLDEERADGSPDHHQRPGHLGAAQDHQARRRLGDDHARGPRRRDRRAAVPQLLPAGQPAAAGGRDPHGQGPALQEQGPARDPRAGGLHARPVRGSQRPGDDQPALDPLHRAGHRAAQGRPRHPPRHDRGAAQAALAAVDQGDAPRRPAAGDAHPGAVRRPQAAPRTGLSGRVTTDVTASGIPAPPTGPGRRPRPTVRRIVVENVAVLVAFAVAGAVAGFVWQRWATPPTGAVLDGRWRLGFRIEGDFLVGDASGFERAFGVVGTYVVVCGATGLLLGVVVALRVPPRRAGDPGAVALGSALAAFVCYRVGLALGPDDPTPAARAAANGTVLPGDLSIDQLAPFVALPLWPWSGLAFTYLLTCGRLGRRRRVAPRSCCRAAATPPPPEVSTLGGPARAVDLGRRLTRNLTGRRASYDLVTDRCAPARRQPPREGHRHVQQPPLPVLPTAPRPARPVGPPSGPPLGPPPSSPPTGAPWGPPPGPPSGPPEFLDSGSGGHVPPGAGRAAAGGGRGRRRGLLVGGGVVGLAAVAGGAFAVYQVAFATGPQAGRGAARLHDRLRQRRPRPQRQAEARGARDAAEVPRLRGQRRHRQRRRPAREALRATPRTRAPAPASTSATTSSRGSATASASPPSTSARSSRPTAPASPRSAWSRSTTPTRPRPVSRSSLACANGSGAGDGGQRGVRRGRRGRLVDPG